MKEKNNHTIYIVRSLAAGLLMFSAFFAFSIAGAEELQENKKDAVAELSQVLGLTIENEEQAKAACNTEANLPRCVEIGNKYNLYSKEVQKTADAFLEEVKKGVAEELKNCSSTDCLIEVANKLAKNLSANNPSAAKSLDFTSEKINQKKAIVEAAQELGVDFKQCRDIDPETAPIALLKVCAKLAKDSRVKQHIGDTGQDFDIDKTVELRETLKRGEFQCGDGTLEGCGNFCLNPSSEAQTQGISAIPSVCYDIAKKFFGQEGVKHLESAYSQVGEVKKFHLRKAEKFNFVTIDGRTLSDPEEIGEYMEEQGKQGNVEAVEKGIDFMIAHGFVPPEEKDFVLKMVKEIGDKGGVPDFNKCRENPEDCDEFIPDEFKEEFKEMKQFESIMAQELGFNPDQCADSSTNPEIAQKCFEGTKKAIEKVEARGLGQKSQRVKFIIGEVRGNIKRGEDFQSRRSEFNQEFQSHGGPGGCKSEAECRAYCSIPENGPECISFGAKEGIHGFRGEEAIQRFKQFNQHIQRPQEFQNYSEKGEFQFKGEGPYEEFTPPGQGGYPPGQQPGFTQPGPGFGSEGQHEPSQECLAAIQSGDFAKAKEVCTVNSPQPVAQQNPGGQTSSQTEPIKNIAICPAMPTVDQCPEGQIKKVAYSSPECGTYYYCELGSDTSETHAPCPPETYWNGSSCTASQKTYTCGTDQYWDGKTCVTSSMPQPTPTPTTTDPSAECAKSGGSWNGSYCQMPSTSTVPSTSTEGTHYQQPQTYQGTTETHSCPQGQYWDGSTCKSPDTTGLFFLNPDSLIASAIKAFVRFLGGLGR